MHLRGKSYNASDVIGVYPLLTDGTSRFLVFDFDNHDKGAEKKDFANEDDTWIEEVEAMRKICVLNGIDPLVERSRSGWGAHIWIFFDKPISAALVRKFGTALLDKGAEQVNLKSFKYYDRMLPAQDTLPKGGLGNLIALPLQGKALKDGNSAFIDRNWNAYPNQWEILWSKPRLPQDILKLGAGGINQIWRDAKVCAAGIKRAQTLVEAAQNSVGLEAGEAARLEIWILVNDYLAKAEQLKRLDEYLTEKVKEVPNVEKLLAIKGVGMSTVIGFIAEVGDIGRFTDPKQIQKLAGLEIVKKSSGKKKGQPRISKRGRRKLRRTMYESARALMTWNPVFQDVFLYYRNRKKNPFGGMQAKIAVACKAIRVFYVVLQTGCDFDEEKFRKDIIRPEAA